MRVRTFFGVYVGLKHIDLTRRAVAEKQTGEGNDAIYSHSNGTPKHGTGESLEFDVKGTRSTDAFTRTAST